MIRSTKYPLNKSRKNDSRHIRRNVFYEIGIFNTVKWSFTTVEFYNSLKNSFYFKD
jgi:hypothetical protein